MWFRFTSVGGVSLFREDGVVVSRSENQEYCRSVKVLRVEMRKAKQNSADLAGDWSNTGTFLRKPAGGWLHEDRELQSGLSINYSVQVK